MGNVLLIVKRTYQANFNKLSKIIIAFLLFLFSAGTFTGTLVLQPNVFPNEWTLNLAMITKNIIITIFVFFIIKKIQTDFKKGYLKNLLVNNFTKQQYYFGTVLAWYFFLVLIMIGNFFLVHIVWLTTLSFPAAPVSNYVLFYLFFFFIAPSAIFWVLILLNYLSFVWQKWESTIEILLLFFIIISIIWFMIFMVSINPDKSPSYWQNYFYLILPFYNLVFSVPQDWELTHITYWWVYIIDGIYLLLLILAFYFLLPKSKILINGKKSIRYFS